MNHQEHQHYSSEEEQEAEVVDRNDPVKIYALKLWHWLGNLSWLEAVGLIAIIILIANQFFTVSLSVTRKPWLDQVVSIRRSSKSLPPQLASGGAQAQSAAPAAAAVSADPALLAAVLPDKGVTLPISWGNLGQQLIKAGVIDQQKFEALYSQAGGMSAEQKTLLTGDSNGQLVITSQNSATVLNLLWALGLGNDNPILNAEMKDAKYGGDAGRFSSTGGWSLASGTAMQHYGMHKMVMLTADQQSVVDRVSKNIYRPCCNNPTHFPDCNHGMAMLALLELMAKANVPENEMYRYALAVNSYWFPNNYLTIAALFKKQGTDWSKVDAKTVLSADYSSSKGYQQVLNQVQPQQAPQSKSGCGV